MFDDFRVADAIQTNSSTQTISGELNVTGGINVGIQSAGTNITTGVITAINFVGTGNTVQYDSSSKTVDISISGSSGGGGLGTAITYEDEVTASPFSYIDRYSHVTENLLLDPPSDPAGLTVPLSAPPPGCDAPPPPDPT